MVESDATGPQKHKITTLSMALGLKEPTEEKPMTSGEAGRLIRDLYNRLRYQNRLKLLRKKLRR